MKLEDRLLNHREVTDEGCWEWTGTRTGRTFSYGGITVDGRSSRVHRVAYELWVGEIPVGKMVLHRCDNPICFRPEHLCVGTAKDNTHDMLRKGRGGGAVGPNGKLTEAKVREIRRRKAKGEKLTELADAFDVSAVTIHHVVKRKTWGWVEDAPKRKVVRRKRLA